MFSTRVVSFFLFVLTFGLFASATPVADAALAKRQDTTDVDAVFTTLKASTDALLPQIDTLVANGGATDNNIAPLITQLTASLDTAHTSLVALHGKPGKPGPSKDEIAKLIAEIVTAIVKTIDGLEHILVKLPLVGPLVFKIDPALNAVLIEADFLVAGVLKLVAALLVDVAGLLKDVAFVLILATLGL